MTGSIHELNKLGQSLWLDYINRDLFESGELDALIQQGQVRGMTSNPSIFNHAIANSKTYDSSIKPMAWAGYTAETILDRLFVEDIQAAADEFRSLYEETAGADGYVSVEVSPRLAYDTEASLAEARRLWELINRPNLMVKIPGTRQGLLAIQRAISTGININITLIFSIRRYEEVMEAYLKGLENRVETGLPVDSLASVASFFVSRIDTKVDRMLEQIVKEEGPQAAEATELMGKIAVANARLAYARFRAVFESPRFERLRKSGANIQRPLWASTSTKNPAYPDTKYVDELIGPHTVNTVPAQTLEAFRDHGTVRLTIEEDLEQAHSDFERLARLGISIDQVTQELEDEGVKAFADSYDSLLETVEKRRRAIQAELGSLADVVARRVVQLEVNDVPALFHEHDPSLWTLDAEGQELIRRRVGWLDLPQSSREWLADLSRFTAELETTQINRVLLLGMGGSSLAPEVMGAIFSASSSGFQFSILDSTDPAQVKQAAENFPPELSLYIASSKSGGTAEVNAMLDFFWDLANQRLGEEAADHFVADHFVAVTDPGTPLEAIARQRLFRRVFLANPAVGGRFSALSIFGLLPASLIGVDVERLLDRAAWMQQQCAADIPAGRNPGLVLGAILGEGALQGKDKLTVFCDTSIGAFGNWLEQLIAESSGKQGQGIIPVVNEPWLETDKYGPDRLFAYLRNGGELDRQVDRLKKAGFPVIVLDSPDIYDLGAEFYRWEVAAAIACSILGVNAFDQPDVQDSKDRTQAKIAEVHRDGRLAEGQPAWEEGGVRIFGQPPLEPIQGGGTSPSKSQAKADRLEAILSAFLAQARPGDYLALNAFLPRQPHYEDVFAKIRSAIASRLHLATTLGFGPRYLHSTGQLHKGGPNNGLFLLFTADPVEDLPIPNEGLTFGTLQRAQALGDWEALIGRGRRALRIHLSKPEDIDKMVRVFEDLKV